jgi:tetratricopeptide (TPR) repeat protein
MVRRSINWVVVVITIVLVSITIPGLYFVRQWQLARTANWLLKLADAEEQRTDWARASQMLDRYLRLRPEDNQARGRLAADFARGVKSSSLADKNVAVELYYRALAAGSMPEESQLRSGLADLLIETGRYKEAESEAHRLLKKGEDPQAMRVLAIALASQLADGSLATAKTEELGMHSKENSTIGNGLVKTVDRARQLNPGDTRLAITAATIYREYPLAVQAEHPGITEPMRHQRANESVDQLVRDNPQSAEAFLARHAYRMQHRLPEAEADLRTALQLAPNDPNVLLAAAGFALSQGMAARQTSGDSSAGRQLLEDSKGHYEKLLAHYEALNPDEDKRWLPHAYLGLGDVWLALNEMDRGIAAWREGIKKLSQVSQPTTLILFHSKIVDACLGRDQLEEAGKELAAIDLILGKLGSSVDRDNKLALTRAQDLRRATWHIRRREPAQAIPLLRQVILSQPKGDANVQLTIRGWHLLGSVYSSLGEWRDAASAFDQGGNLDPSLHQLRLAASSMWLYSGRPDVASERAEQALNHMKTFEAWSALAVAQLQLQSSLPPSQQSWARLETALGELQKVRDSAGMRSRWKIDFARAEYLSRRRKRRKNRNEGSRRRWRFWRQPRSCTARTRIFGCSLLWHMDSSSCRTEQSRQSRNAAVRGLRLPRLLSCDHGWRRCGIDSTRRGGRWRRL